MTGKPTILYIEDDPASRRLVERTLMYAGFDVLVAPTGLSGIDLARSHQPDLILTDINLPDISGHEITTALRSDDRFSRTPIVAITAQGYGTHHDMALAAGVNGFLTKPLEMEKLAERVRYYLNGGQDDIDADRLAAAQTRYAREVVVKLETRIRELEEAHEHVVRLDRIKESFIQITAHELRTPLTLIYGYIRLLEEHPELLALTQRDEHFRELVYGLADSIERMRVVVDEIVTISRIMARDIDLDITQFHLGQLVAKVVNSHEATLQQRRITMHFDATSGWPSRLYGDMELLRAAVGNLVGNAIKYTPDGGAIYIEGQTSGSQAQLSVRDTGIGIDPAEQAWIFEPFNTLGSADLHTTSKTAFGGGGLGLGLPICKGIIEAHGGSIRVESSGRDPERCPGSRFIVTLPLSGTART